MHRARYTARVEDGTIVVEDQDRGRSVTNDAELVVADLVERGFDLSLPVIYRDIAGRWVINYYILNIVFSHYNHRNTYT